jgi:hypothetical protein
VFILPEVLTYQGKFTPLLKSYKKQLAENQEQVTSKKLLHPLGYRNGSGPFLSGFRRKSEMFRLQK